MKTYIKRNKFFFLAILIYLTGIILDKQQIPQSNSNVVSKFKTVLHQKEKGIRILVDSIETILVNTEFSFDNSDSILLNPAKIQSIKDKGYTILIYENDTLKYWTDNLIDFNFLYSDHIFEGKACKWNNQILEIYQKNIYNYNIVGFIRIKSKYNLQNNYLKDEFQKDFNISPSIEVSFLFTSEALPIQDIDNEIPLYLSYGDESFNNPGTSWLLSIIYLLSFLFLILHINSSLNGLYKHKLKLVFIPLILFATILVRIFLLKFKFPINVFSQDFFDIQYYASNWLNSSLGDVILNLMVYFIVAFHFFKLLITQKTTDYLKKRNILKVILSIILLLGGFIIFIFNIDLIQDLVVNSQISFNLYNLTSLNIFSLFGFLSIILIIILSIFIVFKTFKFSTILLKTKQIIPIFFITFVIAIGIDFIVTKNINFISIGLILLLNIIVYYYRNKLQKIELYHFSLIGFLASILVSFIIIVTLKSKQTDEHKLLASQLLEQRDDIGEILLEDIAKKLPNDQILSEYAKNISLTNINIKIEDYLKRRYFDSYWNKYDISVIICTENDSIIKQEHSIFNCKIHFTNLINNHGTELNYPNSYFINEQDFKNSYLLSTNYPTENDSVTFYISLSPKLYPSNIGYPELLLNTDGEDIKKKNYSYAKYINNKLEQKSGSYTYPLNGKNFYTSNEEFHSIIEKDIKHIVYTMAPGDYTIVSYKRITFWDGIVFFSYTFLIFIVLIGIYAIVSNYSLSIKPREWNFRTKLILSMLGILSATFVLIGSVIVAINANQYKKQHQKEVIEKLQEINISLSQKFNSLDSITTSWNENKLSDLDIYLRKLSEILGSDVNIYNKDGLLLATSRPEIFTFNLVGKRINPIALYQIQHNHVSQFIHKEQISSMEFTSAYAQFLNDDDKLLAIINMPYFTKPNAIREELTNLIVAIINIFVVLFLIAIFVSVIISEQIISPLNILQSKFKKLELGKKYEKIEYKRKDEVGDLVREYNKMVEKLDESIVLLSKSERESAWRDMAKQIAHEIKNPLTPMKLSIQLLLRSWENQDEDFDYRLRDMSNTLIQQIETLKRIAEEFSDFAKMPKPQEQVINITDKIEQMSKFYENSENVDVVANLNNFKDIFIITDDKQITRAFINLIKNAIQAIPDGVRGHILLDLDVFNDKVRIKIIDNGTGIPEDVKDKLFLPSFTTKSSGMGIGLAMVKNIINNTNGKISFKSELGKGTTFFLEFPVYTKTDE